MPRSRRPASPRVYLRRGNAENRAMFLNTQRETDATLPDALRPKRHDLVEHYNVGSACGISAHYAWGFAVFARLKDGRVIACA